MKFPNQETNFLIIKHNFFPRPFVKSVYHTQLKGSIPSSKSLGNASIILPAHAFQKVVLKYKLTYIFIFALLCGASKGFMKALKTFIKIFEAPQRNVKIKFELIFSLRQGSGRNMES